MTDKSTNEPEMLDMDALDDILSGLRRETPAPSDALMARVLADAQAELASGAQVTEPNTDKPDGFGAMLLSVIGGWRAVAGLAMATIAGVWIGFAGPDGVSDNLAVLLWPDEAGLTSYALEDLMPGTGDFAVLYEES
jgi:hypothetical protein